MELRYYLILLRRWLWLLLLGLVLGGAGAAIASYYQSPVYQTSTKIMVMRAPEETSSEYSALNDFQLAKTYSQLINTKAVLQLVGDRLGFNVNDRQIGVRQQTDSLIIALTVEDGDPARAALIANTLVEVFIEYNESLQADRFATSGESLKAQITQVEAQIASLQEEMSQLSQENLKTQQQQVEEQIQKLEGEITQVKAEIAELAPLTPATPAAPATIVNENGEVVPAPPPKTNPQRIAQLEDKQKQLNQLESTYNLYQQVYMNLLVLGETTGSGSQNLRLAQLQTTLALYQQIYANLLNNYETVRLAQVRSTPNIVHIEQARTPSSPIRPQPLRNSALGAVTGLLIMGAIAFLIEYLDDTVKGPDEITQHLGLPVLGLVARHESEDSGPITAAQPRAPTAEAFRALRTSLQFASPDRPLRGLLVTSPSPEEGKSTVAANLAVAFAQSGRRVMLMDGDLRRPKVHKLMGLPNRDGLSGLFLQMQVYLDGKIKLERSLQESGVAGLQVMTSGSLPPNPAEVLGSEKMGEVLDECLELADLLVVDSPPVLAVTDAAVLATRLDGVLLVLKPGSTKLGAARQAVEQLRRVGANLLGVVLNDVEFKRSSYYNYEYKYYYYAYAEKYGYGPEEHKNGKHPKETPVIQPHRVRRSGSKKSPNPFEHS